MATPTASNNPARGPHNAATPQSQPHLPNFSSPAPRSVPSPAAQRQAGKSPFAAPTQAQTASSTTAQNHPTVGSSGSASKVLLGSSPAAALMNFESPMPMSFSLSQIAGVEGGVPMAPGMSGLSGLGLLSMSGASDEEKWRRLNEIMEKLKSRPGRVSLENLRALGRRLGFEEMLEQPRTGNTILSFAGRIVLVELAFTPQHELANVDVQFQEPSTALQETAASASKVFHDCLAVPTGQSSITNMLDRFALNLEKLAKIDKPHGTAGDGFNGFEAIAGIHGSLRKLYNHELELARQLYLGSDDAEQRAVIETTCKKSGRPRMNEGGRIGLDLDYWITRRHMTLPALKAVGEGHHQNEQSVESDTFTLSIVCEALQPGHLTQPARISEAWISDLVEKVTDSSTGNPEQVIDWLEPPSTYLASNVAGEQTNNTGTEQTTGKLPNVRFVAKLRPPLLIPAEIAAQNGITQDFTYHTLPSYVAPLLLHKNPLDALSTIGQMPPRELQALKTTITGPSGTVIQHATTLRVRSYDQSILLEDIPFDHPKQLIQILPMLRQFAFLNTMLRESFPISPSSTKLSHRMKTKRPTTISDIDITLSASPIPKLALTFARGTAKGSSSTIADNLDDFFLDEPLDEAAPTSLALSVLPNAQIVIGAHNIGTTPRLGTTDDEKNEKLARALDLTADLDVWIEFIRSQAEA